MKNEVSVYTGLGNTELNIAKHTQTHLLAFSEPLVRCVPGGCPEVVPCPRQSGATLGHGEGPAGEALGATRQPPQPLDLGPPEGREPSCRVTVLTVP